MRLKYRAGIDDVDDDIHKSVYRVNLAKKKMAERFPGPNCDISCRYLDRLRMANRSYGRIASYAECINRILAICGTPIIQWNRDEIERIHREIADSKYANSVKKDTLTCLKRIYHFAMHDEIPSGRTGRGYDSMVSWITPGSFIDRHHKIQPMDLLTEGELMKLIQAVKDSGRSIRRNVAMVFMLLEGAYRPGELLAVRVGGVELGDGYAKVSTTGKTGPKTLTMVSSYDPVREWLADHPRSDDPESYLWFHPNKKGVLPYTSFVYMLKSAQRRANIEKRIWPYLFRHTALTEYSKTLGNVAKVYGNWSKNSNMIGVYEHLASSDQEDAVMRLHGMRNTRRQSAILFSRECASCHRTNSADKEACAGCGEWLEKPAKPGRRVRQAPKPRPVMQQAGPGPALQEPEAHAPALEVRAPEPIPVQAESDIVRELAAKVKKLEGANAMQQKMITDLLGHMGS